MQMESRAALFWQRLQHLNDVINEAWDQLPLNGSKDEAGQLFQEKFQYNITENNSNLVLPFIDFQSRYRYYFSRNEKLIVPFPGDMASERYLGSETYSENFGFPNCSINLIKVYYTIVAYK